MTWFKIKMSIFLLLFISVSAQAHYAIYMDAGSTGTRLYIYQIEKSNVNLPIINEVFSKKVNIGLASFKDNPAGVTQPIKELLDPARDQLEKNKVNLQEVPVNVLSTGGMRLLTPTEQANIYQSIRAFTLKNYSFTLGRTETISGAEEGLYGWLAINYLEGVFQHHSPTFGTLDMGGASTQIAFEVNKDVREDEPLFSLRIKDKDYYILSKSFLGLGFQEAQNSISKDPSMTACYPLHFKINDSFGKFDLDQCDYLYKNVIQSYSINIEKYYPKNMPFIAYDAFYGVLHFFNLDNYVSNKNIHTVINHVCYKSWESMEKEYSGKTSLKYLPYDCANAVDAKVLLFDAYKLNNHFIFIKNDIKKHNITWTCGALLSDYFQQPATIKR